MSFQTHNPEKPVVIADEYAHIASKDLTHSREINSCSNGHEISRPLRNLNVKLECSQGLVTGP